MNQEEQPFDSDSFSIEERLIDPAPTQALPHESGTPGRATEVKIRSGGAAKKTFNETEHPTTARDSQAGNLRAAEYKLGEVVEDRYEIREKLGRGGFGAVYAALDRSLNRVVAIKQSTGLRSFVAGQVRDEARAVASLNHPNIVQIHDLIQVSPVELLIVMERLEGVALSKRLRESRLSVVDAAKVGIEVCAALMHAHEKKLVHSDLKPGNLFVCADGSIKLLDFGLAVAYFPDTSRQRIGGTPGYMSPEQIRGESHLIDGRTDIWAFGVVMFEMLTGTRPFVGKTPGIANQRTLIKSVPPPRQLNPDIDNELQRIVLKCLEPLIGARYPSVVELREDLSHWLSTYGDSNSSAAPVAALDSRNLIDPISASHSVKRGLQPFTELDANAYLSLIPGPRDRQGIPDSIRFWKRWVESSDPNTEHPVGVLYGPSGSGKTSYVRAGLFRQLGPEICKFYVECRPGDLGGRLQRIIETRLQQPSSGSSLRDLLHRLRQGSSREHGFQKLLIVLDQFESWAHNASLDERLDFAEAMRQCDGMQIRVLVVTRDDYWMAAKELLHWLEIPMQEGRNVASVDLLDPLHAQRILESIGRESGSLPNEGVPLDAQQQQFISQAIEELTIDGGVICVHLVMFAQMVRMQKWTPRGLRDSGGVSGACGLFFQELFEQSAHSSPEYRRIAPAVAPLLSELVPAADHNVADVFASKASLSKAVEEAGHGHLFEDCLRLLSEDLRILSVISADVVDFDSDSDPDRRNHAQDRYRLAHDFLVEPINTCLSRMQSRTWRGRTKSRLAESSGVWSRRQTKAHLPGFFEYVSLVPAVALTRPSEVEKKYIRAATKHHAGRISAAMLCFLAFVGMSYVAWNQWTNANRARKAGLSTSVYSLLSCPDSDFVGQVDALAKYGNEADDAVRAFATSDDPKVQLRSLLFLQSRKPEKFAPIADVLDAAVEEDFDLVLSIARRTDDAQGSLNAILEDQSSAKSNRAAILLANLGDAQELSKRLAGSNDAFVDTALVQDAIQWRGNPNLWADLVKTSSDPEVRYRASLVVGSYPFAALREASVQFDFERMINDPSGLIHSTGRFLARHMGVDVFSIKANPPANADWKLGPDNIPMIRLPATDFSHNYENNPEKTRQLSTEEYEIDRPLWMSTIPVSQRLYSLFIQDTIDSKHLYPDGFDPAPNFGVFKVAAHLLNDPNQIQLGVNLEEAYEFCNWLSRREALKECYERTEMPNANTRRATKRPIPWTYDPNANGYRVPTSDEYELAARCEYERGPVSRAVTYVLESAVGDTDASFARNLFTIAPTRRGFFLNDRNAGAWVCGHKQFTHKYVLPDAVRSSVMARPPFPGTAIFLAQNDEAPTTQ